MTIDNFPVGSEVEVSYPSFKVILSLLSQHQLRFEIREGPFARIETVAIEVTPLGNSLFVVSWQEEGGATVTNVQDYDRGVVHSCVTLPGGQLLRMTGSLEMTQPATHISDDRPHRNRLLVLEAMTALFQRHDPAAVDRLYAPDYIQHNPEIPQGRDALRSLVAKLSPDVYYEPGLIIAQGAFVAIHGRIRGWADTSQVVVDLFRVEGGQLAEHWDVLQNEIPASASRGGIAMFDPGEGARGG